MKISKKTAIFLLATFLIQTTTTFAYSSYTEDWEISSFHSEIQINEDSTIKIKETIVADFTNEAHRGIARIIPFKYETEDLLKSRNAQLEFQSATNENGDPWNTRTYKESGYLNIEMTNHENEYRNDINTFVVRYITKNVINPFEEHDEFYWNVNGTDWVVTAKEVTAKVLLPESVNQSQVKIECFTGVYGDTEENCTWEFENEKTIIFKTTKPFEAYENLSIVIGLPKGIISLPSNLKKAWWFIQENKGIFLAPLTLIIMLFLWHKKGRDEKTIRDTIMPHYKPPQGLLPTETGTIIDEKIHPEDITSTIIDFAIKGFIKINETEKKKLIGKKIEHELELIKPYKTTKEFEKLILEGIFSKNEAGTKIKISTLKNKFYKHLPKIKKSVMKQLIKDDYFPHDPSKIRIIYTVIGFIILAIPFHLATVLSIGTSVGMVISGITVMLVGRYLPRKTKKGAETYYILKGLYEYIDTAEKDRMKFQEENKILFEKLLPYAISFGLVKKWAKAFEGILKNPPNWYNSSGTTHRIFYMSYLANSLTSFNKTLTKNIMSKPGSRGGGGWSGSSGFSGGFSGGGFGGGGGRGL